MVTHNERVVAGFTVILIVAAVALTLRAASL
jgi:hypothetical protein